MMESLFDVICEGTIIHSSVQTLNLNIELLLKYLHTNAHILYLPCG